MLLASVLSLLACGPGIQPMHAGADRPDGAGELIVPPDGASDQNPAFAPDGARLVFTRFDDGYNDGPAGLFLLDIEGGRVSRLTPAEDQDNVNLPGSAWSEVDDRIVFASDRVGADDLWTIAPDGSDLRRVTAHSGHPWYYEPSWSPDGAWIVFEASSPGGSPDGRVGEIWKVRDDGTELRTLTAGFDDRQPNWSPAGDRILFQRRTRPDGPWDIYSMSPDGSDLQNITATPVVWETDGAWSPGGNCIVYSAHGGDMPVPNLFAIDTLSGTQVRVTTSESHADSAPSWSPDGGWIAFESREGEGVPASLWRIAVPAGVCGEGGTQ